jgi:hypothetical protein
MKKYLLVFAVIFTANILFAGNGRFSKPNANDVSLVSGKVIDRNSGDEIAGAEVMIGNNVVYTDMNGNFSTRVHSSNAVAIVKYISYNDSKITISPLSYATLVVELESK